MISLMTCQDVILTISLLLWCGIRLVSFHANVSATNTLSQVAVIHPCAFAEAVTAGGINSAFQPLCILCQLLVASCRLHNSEALTVP